jgi:hypothetical protein
MSQLLGSSYHPASRQRHGDGPADRPTEYKPTFRSLPKTQAHSASTRRLALSNTSTDSGRSSQ